MASSLLKTTRRLIRFGTLRSKRYHRSLFQVSQHYKSIYVLGTFDTKAAEIQHLSSSIANKLSKWSEPCTSDTTVKVVDISTSKCVTYSTTDTEHKSQDKPYCVDYTCRDIVPDWTALSQLARNESNAKMTEGLANFLETEHKAGNVNGVIAVGGSCGTAITSSVFTRNLPLGLPKLIISTMAASALSEQYIGYSDLMLMPSIVDVSGTVSNIFEIIAENASSCMVGMAQNYRMNETEKQYRPRQQKRLTVGITMFGITTQCVEFVKQKLNAKYGEDNVNILVFHAVGTGGKCMEYLTENGFIDAVIDITTTEVADYVAGGILSCDAARFDAAKKRNVPTIVSLGAANVVNFGNKESISSNLLNDKQRVWHVHNEQVTLMKANDNELQDIAKFIAQKLNEYNTESLSVLIPQRGISALDSAGSESDFAAFGGKDLNVLTTTLESEMKDKKSTIQYIDAHINDEAFADSVISQLDKTLNSMNISIGDSKTSISSSPRKQKKMLSDGFNVDNPRRTQIMSALYAKVAAGEIIIGGGAGTGISAKCEVMGGCDLVIIYNSGKYRMAGRGSLAGLLSFGDANQIVVDMANEVIPIVKQSGQNTAILAGVNATDPFRDMDMFLSEIRRLEFDGVQNFPTVGLIDGKFRSNLEETGFGYQKEVDVMRLAKEKYGLMTTPYVFDVEQCVQMAQVGVDVIVIHLGLTVGGNIGAKTLGGTTNLDECCEKIEIMANAAYSVNENQIVLVHGGPVATPEDVQYVLRRLPPGTIDGFYGASSMERLPVEVAITDTVKRFKNISLL